MFFYVYILFSKTKKKYYTGYSDSPERRLKQHNAGKTPSTKYGTPWEMVWSSDPLNKSDALILDRKIKKRGAKRFLDSLQKKNDLTLTATSFILNL